MKELAKLVAPGTLIVLDDVYDAAIPSTLADIPGCVILVTTQESSIPQDLHQADKIHFEGQHNTQCAQRVLQQLVGSVPEGCDVGCTAAV